MTVLREIEGSSGWCYIDMPLDLLSYLVLLSV